MTPKPFNVLSVAVGSGRIGFVFTADSVPAAWGVSNSASKAPAKAQAKIEQWIEFYAPDLVITERLTLHTRKSGRTVENINALAEVANKSGAHHIEVERVQRYANKYDEIKALAERYPQIANWAPAKRKLWESEPRNTILFEALSLIGEVI